VAASFAWVLAGITLYSAVLTELGFTGSWARFGPYSAGDFQLVGIAFRRDVQHSDHGARNLLETVAAVGGLRGTGLSPGQRAFVGLRRRRAIHRQHRDADRDQGRGREGHRGGAP
jgi:hypothetical protein